MSGAPSIEFYIDIYKGADSYAYVMNVKFPDQRIDADLELIQDLKTIMGLDPEDAIREILYVQYKAKYMQ